MSSNKTSTSLLLAAGLPLGVMVRREGDEDALWGLIRYGSDFYEVTVPEYRLWASALSPLAPADLAAWGRSKDIAEADRLIAGLRAARLLALSDEDATVQRNVARTYRLHPVGVGVGSSADNPEMCLIMECGGESRVEVDLPTYSVWASSNNGGSLWDVCGRVADSFSLDRLQLASHIVASIPTLMRTNVVFLDRG